MTISLLIFSLTLLTAVLLSGLAHRSVLSTSVLFLAVGFIAGRGVLNLIQVNPTDKSFSELIDCALFAVLFTDGMRMSIPDLLLAWRLPGRALIAGLPLTLAVIALSTHWILGTPWREASLLGAVLSPTDPVFAQAIVGREEVPQRLRNLLNVESGLNDGLAAPAVLLLMHSLSGDPVNGLVIAGDLLSGIAIGVFLPLVVIWLSRAKFFTIVKAYKILFVFSTGLLIFAVSRLIHGNEFLAAFIGGIAVSSWSPEARENFEDTGEAVAEVLKLLALLIFGATLLPKLFFSQDWHFYLLAAVIIFLVRPLALGIALFGSGLTRREYWVALWFGPRGFASVLFSIWVLKSGIAERKVLVTIAAIVIVVSIILHSSTDVLVARRFPREER